MAGTEHLSAFAGSGSPAAAPAALRGRGAATNVEHRFTDASRQPLDDGWHATGAAPAPVTSVKPETCRAAIARNDSPDISFTQAVNPYRGCEHGCAYCYARPTHAYLGYSPGLDFETRLVAKANIVDALRAELARPSYRPSVITLGSATDAYQPIERQWRLSRGILELMLATRHPVAIITKNALVERDLDLLQELARQQLVAVYFSVTTLDAAMARTLEPRASAPWRRLQAMRRLADAGVPVGVSAAPVIPFINDEYLERILEAARDAGAQRAFYTVLRLPWEVREVFERWLVTHFPERAERVLHRIEDMRGGRRNDPRFGTRMTGTGIWADLIAQRFQLAVRRLGLNVERHALDVRAFTPPSRAPRQGPAPATEEGVPRQLGLFDGPGAQSPDNGAIRPAWGR
jgi:DNA repair photolyase